MIAVLRLRPTTDDHEDPHERTGCHTTMNTFIFYVASLSFVVLAAAMIYLWPMFAWILLGTLGAIAGQSIADRIAPRQKVIARDNHSS